MDRLRAKSVSLTATWNFCSAKPGFEVEVFDHHAAGAGATRRPDFRSGLPAQAASFATNWRQKGVIGDWREPDTFRVAAVPLYNSFQDVYRFVERFSAALQ